MAIRSPDEFKSAIAPAMPGSMPKRTALMPRPVRRLWTEDLDGDENALSERGDLPAVKSKRLAVTSKAGLSDR